MDTYSFLRELADSYVMLILLLTFMGVIVFAFRPGSRPIHDDAAQVPFRHGDTLTDRAPGCGNACPDCTCSVPDFLKDRADG